MITISAVIPTFNRAQVLGRALDSVFGQTRRPDEVLVVDDGSTDDTAAVVSRYPEVTLVRLQRNGGAAHARNAGVARARGTWIAFLDSDDAWLPDKLQRQVEAIAGDAGPELICTGVRVHTRAGLVVEHGLQGVSPAEGWTFGHFQNYPFSPSTWLIRGSVFTTVGPFDESLRNCEDLDFLARMSGRHRMQVLAATLVVKHNLADSLDADLERTVASYRELFARYRALWDRAPAAASATYLRLATMHMRAGSRGPARAALLRACRSRPAAALALLAATLVGPQWYERVRRRVTP